MKPARHYRAKAADARSYRTTFWIIFALFGAAFLAVTNLSTPGPWPLLFASLAACSLLVALTEGQEAARYDALAEQEATHQANENAVASRPPEKPAAISPALVSTNVIEEVWEIDTGHSPDIGQVLGIVRKGECFRPGEQAVCLVSRLDKVTEADRQRAQLIAAAPHLLRALTMLMDDIDGLISESEGVAGLHLNGDIAPWGDVDEGGAFERLSGRYFARHAIAQATGKEVA